MAGMDGLLCTEEALEDADFGMLDRFMSGDALYDDLGIGHAAQESQWSSSTRSWGGRDSPSYHASFTPTSSSYGLQSHATSGTSGTRWSVPSSAGRAADTADSVMHATQYSAAHQGAAAAHNSLTAGVGHAQTSCQASLTETSSSHGLSIPNLATSGTGVGLWSGGSDQFGFGFHEDDGEHASNHVQHALLSQRADSPLSHEQNVNLLVGLHSTPGRSKDTAAREGAAAAENTSTAPPTQTKTKFPNWYLKNQERAASIREAGGGEVGKYPWMQVGLRTTEHPRLDAGYMDPATGQEVKRVHERP